MTYAQEPCYASCLVDESQELCNTRTESSGSTSKRNRTQEDEKTVALSMKDLASKECIIDNKDGNVDQKSDHEIRHIDIVAKECKGEKRKKKRRKRRNAEVEGKEIRYLDKHSLYQDINKETAPDKGKNEEDILLAIFEQIGM